MTALTRRSTLAFRSASTMPRTVGAFSMNGPNTPPGSVSFRLPPTRKINVELLATVGSRPTMATMNTSPMADTNTANTMRRMTIQTPRRTAILVV
jgi:hypothetical protein